MSTRGSNDKKTAKFNGLSALKTATLLPIVAALLSACAGAGGKQTADNTLSFAETPPPAEAQADDFQVVVNPPRSQPSEAPPVATTITLRDGAPERYTVRKGDTLWDIAKTFLNEPWLWPEVWYFNPQIVNPHLIYPGDTLVMSYIGNRPQIRLQRNGDGAPARVLSEPSRTVKLSPQIRQESIDAAIPTVSISAISSFLESSRIVTAEELSELPHIVGTLDNHMIAGPGNTIYAVNVPDNKLRFDIIRKGRAFKHHTTGEILGYEALELGKAKLTTGASADGVSSLMITQGRRAVLKYDLLGKSQAAQMNAHFSPSAPAVEVDAEIIALHNAIANVAQNQVIIIDSGSRDGLVVGNVLAIDQAGASVRQKVPGSERSSQVRLPDIRAGLALVFQVYDRLSYALIVDSERAIRVGDKARSPKISQDL